MTHPRGLLAVPGYRASGLHCGLKKERPDLAIIESTRPARVAALFTQNPFAAAPVHVSRQHAANGEAQAIVINAGNANACTGRQGLRDALAMVDATAEALGIAKEQVLVASTGIIGRPLPIDRVLAGIHDLAPRLSEAQGGEVAQAILTTDSGPKEAERSIDGTPWRIGAVAKGAGMIHPNMATMLAFAVTDAPVGRQALAQAWQEAVDGSFNMITVDGDESTNDMAAIMANGEGEELAPGHPAWPAFTTALQSLCIELAQRIVSDGEGATRMFSVEVSGARSLKDARIAARAIAASNLVKCAVHGGDPNWGRIVAALGQSRVPVDGPVSVWSTGSAEIAMMIEDVPQEIGGARLDGPQVAFHVRIGDGLAAATAYGCDMTEEYVAFNAEYST